MTRPALPRRTSDAEFDAFAALCERLEGFGAHAVYDFVDGFLTALVCAPVRVDEARWLEALFDDTFERAFGDPAAQREAMAVLRARIAVLESALDPDALWAGPDRLRLDPLFGDVTDDDRRRLVEQHGLSAADAERIRTGVFWCEGFLEAIDRFAVEWGLDALDPEAATDFRELTAPLRAVLGERDDAAEGDPPVAVDDDAQVDAAMFAVQDLRLWWLDHGPRPATRRVEPPPGRNDACPCGSGRKWKKCHGAAA